MEFCRTCVLLGLLSRLSMSLSGGRITSVTSDSDTIISISRMSDEPQCDVCVNKTTRICHSTEISLTDPLNISVEFTCPQPQELFNVEINREIDCTETSFSVNILKAQSSLFPDFPRTFTWDLKTSSKQTFQLEFPKPGMRQIQVGESCPDQQTYSLVAYLRKGLSVIGLFCKGGPVTTILVRSKGRLYLMVPRDTQPDPVNISVTQGPETRMLAIVKVNLPRGASDTDFFTPNYPLSYPDKQQMRWDFMVPRRHNYTILFNNQTSPECLEGDVTVEYQKKEGEVIRRTLMDRQPEHQQGNFSMALENCETDTRVWGLVFSYRVSVMRSGHPVSCMVDLTEHKDVTLQIEKVQSGTDCEMNFDSKVEKITFAPGTKTNLTFLDCQVGDVRTSQVIGCQNASRPSTFLTVQKLDTCLPMTLHSFTWFIDIPQSSTIDLQSPTGSFRQSLPGQECDQAVSLHVTEDDGVPVGDFCYNGTITQIQVHSRVYITASAPDLSNISGPFLHVSYSEEIPENIIYSLSLHISPRALLATPNWPMGMKPLSTVSWIITVPSENIAHLTFVSVSQPRCKDRHTIIRVAKIGDEEELLSRREDEVLEDELLVDHSFYLNVSNCLPELGQFGVVIKVELKTPPNFSAIFFGKIGVLIIVFIVVAAVFYIIRELTCSTTLTLTGTS
ncbi:CUB domain-containing protein 1-like [Cheilinus undulatus]|uniref:CUB domain-containing protein 1-like n=1 Tax=Cheilinus undulatus TaxID=241271 RepID=UPI001BD60149|nr:CUB domain-containing protein 1-like [Cheilinus undulatus]